MKALCDYFLRNWKWIFPALGAIMLFWELYSNSQVDIIVEPIENRSSAFAMIDAESLDAMLVRSIEAVSHLAGEHRRRLTKKRADDLRSAELIVAGHETYCSEIRTDDFVIFEENYFDKQRRPTIKRSGELYWLTGKWSFIQVHLENLLRWITNSHSLMLRIIIQDDEYGYRMFILAKSLGKSVDSGASYETFGRAFMFSAEQNVSDRPLGSSLEEAVAQELLRFAYPEITAIVLGSVGRSDLAIEGFLSDSFPNKNRLIAIKAGLLNALASRKNRLTLLDDRKRMLFLLMQLQSSEDGESISVSREYLSLYTNRLLAIVASAGNLTSHISYPFFVLENQAIRALRDERVSDTTHAGIDPLDRFDEAQRWADLRLRASSLAYRNESAEIVTYWKWIVETIALSGKPYTRDDDNIRAVLHDNILLYSAYVYAKIHNGLTAESIGINAIQSTLNEFVRFHDRELKKLDLRWAVFDDDERDFIESVIVAIQRATGQRRDASDRASRLDDHVSPCNALVLASAIGVGENILESSASDESSAHENSEKMTIYGLHRNAVDGGLRNFFVHNNMGVLAAELGMKEEALNSYHEAAKYTGEHPWIHINLGALYADNSEYALAESAYRESLRVSKSMCAEESLIWRDLDREYNLSIRKLLSEIPAQAKWFVNQSASVWNINSSCSDGDTSIDRAVYGMLNSLAAQDKSGEFHRVFERYQSDILAIRLTPETTRVALERLREWGCAGRLNSLPTIPSELAEQFAVNGESFVCH